MTLIVSQIQVDVENDLKMGKIYCPFCHVSLSPHGHARTRFVRSNGASIEICPRRSRCPNCKKTQVLLPEILLIRRVDTVEVIGYALLEKAKGSSTKLIASSHNIPFTTIRGWIRRFARKTDEIIQLFNSFALSLDASLNVIATSESKFKDAIEAIGRALNAWRLRMGDLRDWQIVSRISKGALLFNTNSPFKLPP